MNVYEMQEPLLDFAQLAGAVEYTECPRYDTKQSDGKVPIILVLLSTPSLPSLSSSHWPGVVAPDKGPIYGLNRIKPWFREFTVFGI